MFFLVSSDCIMCSRQTWTRERPSNVSRTIPCVNTRLLSNCMSRRPGLQTSSIRVRQLECPGDFEVVRRPWFGRCSKIIVHARTPSYYATIVQPEQCALAYQPTIAPRNRRDLQGHLLISRLNYLPRSPPSQQPNTVYSYL